MNFPALKKIYDYDKELAAKGVDMFVGINAKGEEVSLVIARAGTAKHEEAQRRYSDELERTRYSPEKRREVTRKIVCEGIFLGWKNMLSEDGETYIEPTFNNRIKALEQYEDLAVDIIGFANNNANFQTAGEKIAGVDAIEESEKN